MFASRLVVGLAGLCLVGFAGVAPQSSPPERGSTSGSVAEVRAFGAPGGGPVGARTHASGVGAGSSSTATSPNWAGWVDTGSTFTNVHARWTVTAATCTTSDAWAGMWVGLDGWTNDIVEQGGTSTQCVNGTPNYRLWWEMYPHNSVQLGDTVAPGDVIDASVTYGSSGTFDIEVTDETSGAGLSQTVACFSEQDGCPRSSAEVVSEDIGVYGSSSYYALPNYGTTSYSNVTVGDASTSGNLLTSAWDNNLITESRNGVTLQTTSQTNGTSFSTTWQHD